MPLKAGELDRRIQIEQASEAPDSFGQNVQTWSLLATLWAKFEPDTGDERFTAEHFVEAA